MTINAFVFDLDCTLTQTHEMHARAWFEALDAFGYHVHLDRIRLELAVERYQLVETLLGPDAEQRIGHAIRVCQDQLFSHHVAAHGAQWLAGAKELLDCLRERHIKIGLLCRYAPDTRLALERALGVRFADIFDYVTAFDDATEFDRLAGAPAPTGKVNYVSAACAHLGEETLGCALVGSSVHDARASRLAGTAFVGITSAFATRTQLRAEGARFIATSLGELVLSLNEVMTRISHSRVNFRSSVIGDYMACAIQAAEFGLSVGEVPIGAAIFDSAGDLVASGYNRENETGDATCHAEMDAFRKAALAHKGSPRGRTLVSTLEPCVMCLGAAMEAGIDVVIYGLAAAADGGTTRLLPPTSPQNAAPQIRGNVQPGFVRDLFVAWLRTTNHPAQRPYVEQLLASSAAPKPGFKPMNTGSDFARAHS